MKKFSFSLVFILLFCYTTFYGQPSYYDLTYENDSISVPFKSSSENYVFVRSKRGVDGVNQTSEADAVRSGSIQKIILVFSEDSPGDLENREEYNMERWDNLILTYPEFFQEKTKYKNVCQCTASAGEDSFKQVQGFYIYYKTAEKPVAKKEALPAQTESTGETGKVEKTVIPAAVVTTGVVVEKSSSAETILATETPAKPADANVVVDNDELEPVANPVVKPAAKKPISNKPRRANDPKACRPAFYGSGDEDLDAFFRDHFVMDKKQKKQAKKVDAELRIQLNVDGSVKRVMAICTNTEFKSMFEKTVMGMSNWNAAVRNGVTVRSEVRLKVKYDKESKGFKKYEMINSPKPGPKCKMLSDEELFGS